MAYQNHAPINLSLLDGIIKLSHPENLPFRQTAQFNSRQDAGGPQGMVAHEPEPERFCNSLICADICSRLMLICRSVMRRLKMTSNNMTNVPMDSRAMETAVKNITFPCAAVTCTCRQPSSSRDSGVFPSALVPACCTVFG